MDGSFCLGVDFGSTFLKIALVTCEGEIIGYKKYPSQGNAMQTLQRSIADYLSSCPCSPAAIGIGLVGMLDIEHGVWVHSLNMNVQEPIPITEHLKNQFHLPIFIDNDVHAAALAEKRFGVGRVTNHFILVNVGTGIAAGLVCDGRLIRGVGNASGEIGHMCVEYDGAPCTCGSRGCLEMIAGGRGLSLAASAAVRQHPESLLARIPTEDLNAEAVFLAARKGDPVANELTNRAVRALGIGIVNLVNTLNPEHIVLSGSVMNDDVFMDRVRDFVYEHAYITALRCLAGFSRTQLAGGNIGVCGAATLCWEMMEREACQ